jgi:HAD superfamily hydrolase (TIGR01509 family)
MEIKVVVFDLDGVLFDTERVQLLGWVAALKPYSKGMNSRTYMKYAGKAGPIIVKELIRDMGIKVTEKELISSKEKYVIDYMKKKPVRIMPYAKQALSFFSGRKIKMAAATSAPRGETLLKLKKSGFLPYFDVIVSRDDVRRGKPFPDVYVKTAEKLGMEPALCLAVEDTQAGLQSAKSAGLACIAVPTELTKSQDFSSADYIAKDLRDATAWTRRVLDK